MVKRCEWAGSDELYKDYHDNDWGVPVHDDRKLFEMLILEGAQAGLSWRTILTKRGNYLNAFDNFVPAIVAAYDEIKIQELLNNPGIVRNKLKVRSAVSNAQIFLKVQEEFGSFDKYIWGFVGHKPIINARKDMREIPAKTEEAETMSKDMKKRGFKFVGPTICYAYMQSVGLVNDHSVDCFRYEVLS